MRFLHKFGVNWLFHCTMGVLKREIHKCFWTWRKQKQDKDMTIGRRLVKSQRGRWDLLGMKTNEFGKICEGHTKWTLIASKNMLEGYVTLTFAILVRFGQLYRESERERRRYPALLDSTCAAISHHLIIFFVIGVHKQTLSASFWHTFPILHLSNCYFHNKNDKCE